MVPLDEKARGLKKFAWIYGPFKLSQVSTDESLSYLRNSNIPIRTFYDIDEGLAWLNTASDSFASKPGKANEVNSD